MEAVEKIVTIVLRAHEPYPALAIDRHWNLSSANGAVASLLEGVDAKLLDPPVNVLRLSLHPLGLSSRILNLPEWRAHLLLRLSEQIEQTADPSLKTLMQEIVAYPAPAKEACRMTSPVSSVSVLLQLATRAGVVSMISTTMVFGTPLDITLSELAIECFFPAEQVECPA